jgi:thiamine biosynthesis lipoprotein
MITLSGIVLCFTLSTAGQELLTRSRQTVGTQVNISISNVTPELAERGFNAAFAEFDRVNAVMNEWRPDSALSAINEAAGTDRFVPSPEDLCAVLRKSLDAARRTNGLFDPTWAALRDLWRFGTNQSAEVPSAAAVKATCPLVSYRDVELRTVPRSLGACEVRLKKRGMKLGLGGVAKGWAIDRAVAALRALGLRDFFVQAGGDRYAARQRGDRPWRVGIRDPRGSKDQYFAQLDVSNAAFSTSGDYERFFIVDGRRYHEIIDPRTCYPATATRSATVLARTAVDAEFLTKATFILGGAKALELAESWGAGAVLVSEKNDVLVSNSLKGKLKYQSPTP